MCWCAVKKLLTHSLQISKYLLCSLILLICLYSVSFGNGNREWTGIGIGSLHVHGNDVGRNLGIEWEMGMLVWEWEKMGTRNPFPHTSNAYTARAYCHWLLWDPDQPTLQTDRQTDGRIRPRYPVSPKFLMGFCSDRHVDVSAKFAVGSFTRSWDNSDCNFGLGMRTPNIGEGEELGVVSNLGMGENGNSEPIPTHL